MNKNINTRHLKSDDEEDEEENKGGKLIHRYTFETALSCHTISGPESLSRLNMRNDKFLQNYLNQILCSTSFVWVLLGVFRGRRDDEKKR